MNYELMKAITIALSLFLALASTFYNLDVVISRVTRAIREVDCKWTMSYKSLAFYWALFMLSCIIQY